ncbi:MAG: glycosyltransferase [Victivallaceae bacterium]|nr:glycosyltransferase [Victivallaceae bacterium]
MIFVTTGHCFPFNRLISRMDELAGEIHEEEIIMQTGAATVQPKNCKYFAYEQTIEPYYERARLVVTHGGFSTMELINRKVPMIIVPRQYRFKEHHNDHQVEFAELLELKFKVKVIMNISDLNADLLRNYDFIPEFKNDNLSLFREAITRVLLT